MKSRNTVELLECRSDSALQETTQIPDFDLDGDGLVSPWESNLCRLCLIGALMIAFGDKIITVL